MIVSNSGSGSVNRFTLNRSKSRDVGEDESSVSLVAVD